MNILNIAQKAKRVVKALLGKDSFSHVDFDSVKERFGSQYGGWDIVVDQINERSVVYSFGVGEDATFDMAIIQRFCLNVNAFDPTPKSIEWVQKQNFPVNFCFHRFGIADFDGTISFNPPDNPEHVSYSILDRPTTKNRAINVPVKRLSTIMKELGHDKIDILKMDVEGAEYCVLENMEKSDIRPQQILIEFHHRFPGVGVRRTKGAIKQIRDMGYSLFSISSSGEEFCFIKTR